MTLFQLHDSVSASIVLQLIESEEGSIEEGGRGEPEDHWDNRHPWGLESLSAGVAQRHIFLASKCACSGPAC